MRAGVIRRCEVRGDDGDEGVMMKCDMRCDGGQHQAVHHLLRPEDSGAPDFKCMQMHT
jgi:hypothetical protein